MSKPELNYAGIIVIAGICIILGAGLLPTIGTYTGQMINSNTLTNGSFNVGSTVGGITDLTGQDLLSTPVVVNGSGYVISQGGNYTITEGVSTSTGNKVIRYTKLSNFINGTVKVTYNYGGDGYVEDSGTRAIIPLIIVFFALLIMAVAIIPVFRQGFLDVIGYK
jgi:hypothetical protein